MDCTVHGVTKSRTRLSDFHFPSLSHMATLPITVDTQVPAGSLGKGPSAMGTLLPTQPESTSRVTAQPTATSPQDWGRACCHSVRGVLSSKVHSSDRWKRAT